MVKSFTPGIISDIQNIISIKVIFRYLITIINEINKKRIYEI